MYRSLAMRWDSFFTAIAEGINSANQTAGAAQGAVARIQSQVAGATNVPNQSSTSLDFAVFTGASELTVRSAHFAAYYGNNPHLTAYIVSLTI